MMESTVVNHRIVLEDEFDALSIEVDTVIEQKEEEFQKYPAKCHARKVAEQLGADHGLIYLPGQVELSYEDADQGPPFRQRRYFYYISGANFAGCAVTYDISADKLTLWIPYTPPATILYFGNTPTPEACLAKYDVHDVKYISELPKYLASRLASVRSLYALHASQVPKFDGAEQLRPRIDTDITSLQPAMDRARVIKTNYEIAAIRKANAISSKAHGRIADAISGYANECQVEAAFLASCTADNAHAQSYGIIAGSGVNASTLHYDANNEPLVGRQAIVIDAGAEWECYASDITRTLPLGREGKFTAEAAAIYSVVKSMQEECIERVRPGVVYRDLQLHASLVAVKGLLALGILKGGSAAEIFKSGTAAAFFPHGLGHHVGLDVHDVLSHELLRPAGEHLWGKRRPVGPQTLRALIKQAATEEQDPRSIAAATKDDDHNEKEAHVIEGRGGGKVPPPGVLRPGMVVTIEPGIYFCRPYIDSYFLAKEEHRRFIDVAVLEKYAPVGGVRIEDCILVTGAGYENLTTAPKY
ncbi:Xaa-Pro dipeptidase [Microdochium nivale]|nr:Xaa-Pro dipeptidase [Microdochium nivale]